MSHSTKSCSRQPTRSGVQSWTRSGRDPTSSKSTYIHSARGAVLSMLNELKGVSEACSRSIALKTRAGGMPTIRSRRP